MKMQQIIISTKIYNRENNKVFVKYYHLNNLHLMTIESKFAMRKVISTGIPFMTKNLFLL